MKFFSRRQNVRDAREGQPCGGFAEWLLRQFAGGRPMASMPYGEIERICANAGSLLVGAVHARPADFEGVLAVGLPDIDREAALLSRRTADGFRASLADRKNTVMAWPWDHMATKVAWDATRQEDTSEAALGAALLSLGSVYAMRHREQVAAVLSLWTQVAAGVSAVSASPPDLSRMGAEMLAAYEASRAA
ncbi:MAG: hypothetical protein IPH65_10315 [Dehalococcoidia bacterium]|uniref:hypothetical protein n=1 Tax=Candidatus Amarobacter glycogenicus TaxID=3140699 RepID=UPI0031371791|nr:hypothetical protein [Dehalococcoidia bacterium]